MALKFLHRGVENAARVTLFPGTWNPPTVAHLDIARAALKEADEVIWVLPRAFPHKGFEGAGFEARCEMVGTIARNNPGFSAAVSEGGLYAEIAAEAAADLGGETAISLVLGKDAAERIAAWDYGKAGVFDDFVRRYRLLVAARHGEYDPMEHHRAFITALPVDTNWDAVSSSEVRRRIGCGEDWRALVPASIAALVEDLY